MIGNDTDLFTLGVDLGEIKRRNQSNQYQNHETRKVSIPNRTAPRTLEQDKFHAANLGKRSYLMVSEADS